jgi:hypothetical protein
VPFFGHFLLAALGLLVWVVYVINDSQGLAWVAFVDLVVVAGLGDHTRVPVVQGPAGW